MFLINYFTDMSDEPDIEFGDPYIPMTATWPQYGTLFEPPVTRLAVGENGHLELQFEPNIGQLVAATLVAANSVRTSPEKDCGPAE